MSSELVCPGGSARFERPRVSALDFGLIVSYKIQSMNVTRTDEFDRWLARLKDPKALAKILIRIERLELGNPGDVKAGGGGISEMRIDYGLGYRVYYKRMDEELVLLLCGGDKSTQDRDIRRAKELAAVLGWNFRR